MLLTMGTITVQSAVDEIIIVSMIAVRMTVITSVATVVLVSSVKSRSTTLCSNGLAYVLFRELLNNGQRGCSPNLKSINSSNNVEGGHGEGSCT